MNQPVAAIELKAIRLDVQVMRWTGYYLMTLWCLLAAWMGVLVMALVGIAAIEMIRVFSWRTPPPVQSFTNPIPAAWQMPIQALRWYLIIRNIAGLASGALIGTIVMVVIGVVARPSRFGVNNLVVLIAIALWLASRPIWFPPLAKAMRRTFQDVQLAYEPQVSAEGKVSITADGIDMTVAAQRVGDPSTPSTWTWHVAWSEIDEMRMLAAPDATAYVLNVMAFDPTLPVRVNVDFVRYARGQIQRPSTYLTVGTGPNLLIHGSNLLYLFGLPDGSGAAALAAWRATRATAPAT